MAITKHCFEIRAPKCDVYGGIIDEPDTRDAIMRLARRQEIKVDLWLCGIAPATISMMYANPGGSHTVDKHYTYTGTAKQISDQFRAWGFDDFADELDDIRDQRRGDVPSAVRELMELRTE